MGSYIRNLLINPLTQQINFEMFEPPIVSIEIVSYNHQHRP